MKYKRIHLFTYVPHWNCYRRKIDWANFGSIWCSRTILKERNQFCDRVKFHILNFMVNEHYASIYIIFHCSIVFYDCGCIFIHWQWSWLAQQLFPSLSISSYSLVFVPHLQEFNHKQLLHKLITVMVHQWEWVVVTCVFYARWFLYFACLLADGVQSIQLWL